MAWSCGNCHDHDGTQLVATEQNITWGVYEGFEHSKCEKCKERCEKDEKCEGVQCYPKEDAAQALKSRFNGFLTSCIWRSKKLSNECISNASFYHTCWKNGECKMHKVHKIGKYLFL